jgi:Kef-type K+ transport system membrane component KefB
MDKFLEHINFTLPFQNPILIFSIVLFIILFSPLALNRFKIPHIIGFIICGIIFGPNGFNILSRDQSFQLFGQVGLLYIMFLAGLELDITDFKKNKKKGIFFGMTTFMMPMIFGLATSYFILNHLLNVMAPDGNIQWNNNLNIETYLLLATILFASMYASHTLLSYPIVGRFGITKNSAVSTAVGGTMITDTLALLILAVIAGMTKGEVDSSFWMRLIISILAFAFIVIYIFPKIAEQFFKRYDDSILQYIFVLAMLFLGAFLAELTGLEAIIGAFFAGLSLNKLIPRISPLMNRIDFVGNALFIPFFLIGVGMLINLNVVFNGFDTLIVSVVMCAVALSGKYLAAIITRKTFKMSKDEGLMIFGLSNSQAAATLAVVMVGYNIIVGHTANGTPIRFFNDDILSGAIVTILVTCTIASFATEKAARKLAVQQDRLDEDMTTEKLADRILIPVYNPETLNSLMELAVLLKAKKSKEPLYTLSVANDATANADSIAKGKKLLEKAASIAAATDNTVRMITRYDINVTSGIIHTIKENYITEVVMGLHHKSSFADSFFGAKTDNLLRATNQMILISKSIQPISTIKRVIIAVPEKAEFEVGFVKWYDRVKNLCKQIGATASFFAHPDTLKQIRVLAQRNKFGVETRFEEFDDWDDFLMLTREVGINDLFVIVVSRKTSISYNPAFEKLPGQLSKYFANNSFIVLYPDQFAEQRNEDDI